MAEPTPLDSPLWSDLEAAFSVDKALVALVPLDAAPRCLLAAGTTLIVGTDTGATVVYLT